MSVPPILKKVLLPAGFVVFAAAMWFGLYRPEMAKISEFRQKPLANRQQIQSLTMQLSAYQEPSDSERAEWGQLENEIRRKIPKGKDITGLYASLSELAEKCKLVDFQRQLVEQAAEPAVINEGGIARQSFDLTLTFQCGYPELIEFIHDVRRLDRLVEVIGLDVTRGVPNINVSMNLKCYYAPES